MIPIGTCIPRSFRRSGPDLTVPDLRPVPGQLPPFQPTGAAASGRLSGGSSPSPAPVAQLIERRPSKPWVAGSNPAGRARSGSCYTNRATRTICVCTRHRRDGDGGVPHTELQGCTCRKGRPRPDLAAQRREHIDDNVGSVLGSRFVTGGLVAAALLAPLDVHVATAATPGALVPAVHDCDAYEASRGPNTFWVDFNYWAPAPALGRSP